MAMRVTIQAAIVAMLFATGAIAQDWRRLDPENTLLIDTTKGRIIVEMRPELAPKAVARVKLLSRERVYDGLQFHRVIEGFVAQTGNPNNKDGGVSRHRNLEPEFTFRLTSSGTRCDPSEVVQACAIVSLQPPLREVVQRSDGIDALLGSMPISGEETHVPRPNGHDSVFRGWGVYCKGVVGLGRQADPGSANSEMFFMLAPERRLDHDYTAFGRVVYGAERLKQLAVGEPPRSPDRMLRVRVASDLPALERPRLGVNETELFAWIEKWKETDGAKFSICDVEVSVEPLP